MDLSYYPATYSYPQPYPPPCAPVPLPLALPPGPVFCPHPWPVLPGPLPPPMLLAPEPMPAVPAPLGVHAMCSAQAAAPHLVNVFSARFLQLSEDLQDLLCLPSHSPRLLPEFTFRSLQFGQGLDAGVAGQQQRTTFPSLLACASDKPSSQRRPERRPADWANMQNFTGLVNKVLAQPLITPPTLFLALFYGVKVLHILAQPATSEEEKESHRMRQQEFVKLFLGPVPIATAHKMFELGLVEANKYLDDHPFHNKAWESIGMDLDLNRLERWFLSTVHYDLTPAREEWDTFLDQLSALFVSPPTTGVFNFVPFEHFGQSYTTLCELKGQGSSFGWDDCPALDPSSSVSSPHSLSPTLSTASTPTALELGSPMSWTCSEPSPPQPYGLVPLVQGYYPAYYYP